MTTITKTLMGTSVAVVALFSLAFTFSTAKAADLFDGGWYADSYADSYGPSYDYDSTGWYADSYTDSYPASYDSTGWYADSYTDSYPASYDYGYSPSYSSPSFSYPSFTSIPNQQYRQQILPQLPTFAQPNVANACTAPNTCNVDNSYTDNSVYAPDNSYTYTNTVTDNSVFNAPTTVTVTAPTTISHDSHNQQISYPVIPPPMQYQYQAQTIQPPVYQPPYQPPVYHPPYMPQQPRPVTYSQTPYISLSQTPYTGLELTPAQEVLYWSFLVLWCLAIAYLIVYKRVLGKTVSFLNGFLFGTTANTSVSHAHVAHKAPAVKAELVEEGIDPFIASQIKR